MRLLVGGMLVNRIGSFVVPYLTLVLDSVDEVERVYSLLADGGQIFMPMEETFFAHRFAMLRDRFGTSWMLLHERAPA